MRISDWSSDVCSSDLFFIVFLPRMQLDKKYTVFGRVIEGMQYVDAIHEGEPPADPTIILQASIESDGKPPVTALPTPPAQPTPSIAEIGRASCRERGGQDV